MLRLLAAVLCALIAFAAPAAAFEGNIRLKLVQVEDLYGFDKPLPAFSILVPNDWKTEGGIVWEFNGSGCGVGTPYLNWTATGPDGVSAVQILPSENWSGMSYAPNPEGCPKVMTQNLPEFIRWYVNHYRGSVRNFAFQPKPEYAAEFNKGASRTPNALGGESLVYAEAGQATFEWDYQGRTIREQVGLVAVFNVTNNPGGYLAVSVALVSGMALRAPAEINPADYELFASTFLPVPGYVALIQEFQARMQAIALKGVMDRAAIWRQVQAEISQIISDVYANAQAAYDRTSAESSRAMRGVDVYTDPATGQKVELPNSASVWRMPDGTYVISDDPNYDPAPEHGDGGTKMTR